jgi:hypothetical protein
MKSESKKGAKSAYDDWRESAPGRCGGADRISRLQKEDPTMCRNSNNPKTRILFLCMVVMALGLGQVVAQTGTWTPTDSLAGPRRDHTATLLPDGKVLIVGWFTDEVEVYDPATDTFGLAGYTIFGHGQGSSATLLPDGTVLIVGGDSGSSLSQQAEILDPTTMTFSPTVGVINAIHHYHTSTLLHDGTVLIAAGQFYYPEGPQSIATAEIYDPTTGLFSLTGSLHIDRSQPTATLLSDGRVLVVGGTQTTTPGYGIMLDTAEIYDPGTGSFTLTGSLSEPQIGHTATTLASGEILIVGRGFAETYDPITASFTSEGLTLEPRWAHTATTLPDGKVLLAGGVVEVGPVTTNSAEIFDPVTLSFVLASSMNVNRQQHTATLLPDGRVLVVGGYDGAANTDTAELFSASPESALEDLIGDIESLDLPGGLENALTRKLENAILSLESGNVGAAVNRIQAFINQVNALRGKKLTDEEADALIAQAEAILAQLL